MAAVGVVLLGVWAIGRQGEREAQLPHVTTPLMRRLGLVSMLLGAGMIVIALVALIGGDPGRSVFYVVFGLIQILAGRESRRGDVVA
jgi:hypothetical protein